eukprot:429811_1
MKEPLDLDKNQTRAVFHHIKALFGLGITFVKLMLHRKKIGHIGKEKNFLNDSLVETFMGLLLPTIFRKVKMKKPLDFAKNQTREASHHIKTLFDPDITFVNLMLHQKKF